MKAVLMFAILLLLCQTAVADPNILILHSYHEGNEWTDSIGVGIKEGLQNGAPKARLFIEHMDFQRQPPEVITPFFKAFLTKKYATQHFDLILCSNDDALNFLKSFRDELFPDVPVVFCGISDVENGLSDRKNYTGVIADIDIEKTLALALQLQPETLQVAVISDASTSGRRAVARLRKALPFQQNNLQFSDLTGMSASRLEEALATLHPRTIVLLLHYFNDEFGRYFSTEEGNRLISRISRRPVFSLWDFRIKSGVVGGHVISGYQQGALSAEKALRILQGERPADIPVTTETSKEYLFDYEALARFNISLNDLPENSRVLNRQTFYQLSQGQLLGALLTMSLITLFLFLNIIHRRRAEKALQNRQSRLKAIHENVAAGIALLDVHGFYLEVNGKWAELFGFDPGQIVGKHFLDLTFPEDRNKTCKEFDELLQCKKDRYRLQKRCTRKDGTIFWVDSSETRIMDEQGQVKALVSIIIDITEHKQVEEELKVANQELDGFVSTISHDLRSPLTLINGFAEFLLNEYRQRFDDRGVTALNHIEQSGHKMQQLLEDLLAFARVGYLELPCQPIDVNMVAFEVALIQSQKAPGIAIERAHLPAIRIPRSFLLLLFDNLIGNAVRYACSEGGTIEVGGKRDHNRVRYFVRDHGPGISWEERERIFEPFYRCLSTTSIPGTGIGLGTVKKIVNLYGGRVWVEETSGGGCTFWMEMVDEETGQKSPDKQSSG